MISKLTKPKKDTKKPKETVRLSKSTRTPKKIDPMSMLKNIKKSTDETKEQISFIYGVLEELSARQEIQSNWLLDFAEHCYIFFGNKIIGEANATGKEQDIKLIKDSMDDLAHEVVGTAGAAIDTISKKRTKEKIAGLKKAKKIINATLGKDEKDNVIIILPLSEEIH